MHKLKVLPDSSMTTSPILVKINLHMLWGQMYVLIASIGATFKVFKVQLDTLKNQKLPITTQKVKTVPSSRYHSDHKTVKLDLRVLLQRTRTPILCLLRGWRSLRSFIQEAFYVQRTKHNNLATHPNEMSLERPEVLNKMVRKDWCQGGLTAPIHCSQLKGCLNQIHDSIMLTNCITKGTFGEHYIYNALLDWQKWMYCSKGLKTLLVLWSL